jgi:hypothetical protein
LDRGWCCGEAFVVEAVRCGLGLALVNELCETSDVQKLTRKAAMCAVSAHAEQSSIGSPVLSTATCH